MHSKDGVRIVYACPDSFQIQNGSCVIRVYFWPQVMAKFTMKMSGHFAAHIKICVNLEAVVTVISGFDI